MVMFLKPASGTNVVSPWKLSGMPSMEVNPTKELRSRRAAGRGRKTKND